MPRILKLPTAELRPYQREMWNAMFRDGYRNMFIVASRRTGKDLLSLNLMVAAACQRVGLYLYIFPFSGMAKKVVWDGITNDGFRFIDYIPKELVAKTNASTLTVTLINGSKIQFAGSSNLTGLIGSNPVGIVLSEFPLHAPMVHPLLSPILAVNNGWLLLQGTPRGPGPSYDLFKQVQNDPKWFVRTYTALDAKYDNGERVVTEEMIEQERRNGLSQETIDQEFFCSWSTGDRGAFYSVELGDCERENRICPITITSSPVYVFMDLGISDNTSIIWVQASGNNLNIIYSYENTGYGLEHYVGVINDVKKKFSINIEAVYAPHDIQQREFGSGRSRIEIARSMGLHLRVCNNISVEDGIQAAKSIFPRVKFHVEHTSDLVRALSAYKREWDEVRRVFNSKPYHNWASNFADAFRYFAVTWKDLFVDKRGNAPFKYETHKITAMQPQQLKSMNPAIPKK